MSSRHRHRTLILDAVAPAGSDALDRIAFLMLLVFVLAAPALFTIAARPDIENASAPPPILMLNVYVFATVGFALLSRSSVLTPQALPLSLGAAGGLALLGAGQLLRLPEGLMRTIASVNLRIYHETAQLLRLFGRPEGPAPRISIAPAATAATSLGICGLIALFIGATSLLRTRIRRRVFTWALIVGAAFPALLHVLTSRRLFEAPASAEPGRAMTAGYVAIALCAIFGMLWTEVLTNPKRGVAFEDPGDRLERRFAPVAILVALWLTAATAMAATLAMATIWSALASSLVVIAFAVGRRRGDLSRTSTPLTVIVLSLAGCSLAARAWAAAADGAMPVAPRGAIWSASLAAWRDFPLVGSGLGTFREAFRFVQPREIPRLVDQPPSRLVELLVTGGLAGVILGAAAVVSLLVALLRAWRAQRHREESAIALATFGTLFFLTLAGLVEVDSTGFPVSMVAAPWLGAGWAASHAQTGAGL